MNRDYKSILSESEALFPQAVEIRRRLHGDPELSFCEHRTSEFIASRLEELAIPFERVGETGLIGEIGSGNNCVALRADMDALPVSESVSSDFASRNPGAMHACGHDLHMAMALTAGRILKERESELKGTVRLIFQPGEEKLPGGAFAIVNSREFLRKLPGKVFGQHVNPGAPTGSISVSKAEAMAATDELYWTVKGRGCHAATPHLGVDPVTVSAQIINALQTIVSREKNPLLPGLLSITSIASGNTTNVIPDTAEMKGTMRTFDSELRAEMKRRITTVSRMTAEMHRAECDLKIVEGYPALINDAGSVERIFGIAKAMFGQESVTIAPPKMWAEDFAYYARAVPSVFWFTGVSESCTALHTSGFDPDEKAMINGTALLVASALDTLD